MIYDPSAGDYSLYDGIATFAKAGYSSFLHGNVVDMLHFPMIHGTFPTWFPVWGGEKFEFFSPIFNIADAAISSGIITIVVFQNRFFNKKKEEVEEANVDTETVVTDDNQIS